MIDIGKRAKKLVDALVLGKKNGYGAVDARAESPEEWSKDYAIIQDVDYEPMEDEQPYFDRDAWKKDMEIIVDEVFLKGCKESVAFLHGRDELKVTAEVPKKRVFRKWVQPGTIIIHWHGYPSHELEIYRAQLPPKEERGPGGLKPAELAKHPMKTVGGVAVFKKSKAKAKKKR